MKRQDFNFDLKEELIAQTPLLNRSSSRLLVLNKKNGNIEHKNFVDIIDYINAGDCLVINDTKVLPARLIGIRESTSAKVEILLLKRIDKYRWEVLVNPGKKAKIGDTIVFSNDLLKVTIEDIVAGGNRIVKFSFLGIFEEILDKLGEMPLPPYITEKLTDKNRYQTVYAKNDGSAAAPTAGLHFTDDLLASLQTKGVKIARVTLHVGLGTFRPVKVENILDHEMHKEYYTIAESEANIINTTKKNNGKIIAVGTTSSRTLEACSNEDGFVNFGQGETGIFIYPGYNFKVVDKLITNFHLPESTLIMLVSALCGRENTLNAYNEAVKLNYRFFSFGDAMFITE